MSKISQLPVADTIDGGELIAIVQAGQTRRATAFGLAEGANLLSWPFLSDAYSEVPADVGRATVAGEDGDVLSYTLQGVTRFRFIPDDYDPTLDAFYAAFAAGELSDLIVARG
jgi:hypothetical protein